MKVLHIVGARPNFMKVAPVMRALTQNNGLAQTLVHTGQHYDANMSEIFFRQLDLPEPDVNLEVGSGSHSVQTARIMIHLEEYLMSDRPDLVLVYGDVNSTVAAAIVCAKLLIPLAHVEAGLRSGDRTMPEEINRLVTDQIANYLFTPSVDGNENLVREGVAPQKIHLVGNVMIDTLVHLLPRAERLWETVAGTYDLKEGGFGLVTLHRPSNVDEPESLSRIMAALDDIADHVPLIFPVHPRTRNKLKGLGFEPSDNRIRLLDPVGYLEFLALQQRAQFVITDSGGVQEETTYLQIPCLTVRENTERPVTVAVGTNILIGQDMERLRKEVGLILEGKQKRGEQPILWDGNAGERIANVITRQ